MSMTGPGRDAETVRAELIDSYGKILPRFSDGRIDYTGATSAPVITVFVLCGRELLLLKRSENVAAYKGRWNTVAGYLDDTKTLARKALEELGEEAGIQPEHVERLDTASPFTVTDKEIGREWHIFPVLATLKERTSIVLDFEHTDYAWIYPEQAAKYDTVPGFWDTLQKALGASLLKEK